MSFVTPDLLSGEMSSWPFIAGRRSCGELGAMMQIKAEAQELERKKSYKVSCIRRLLICTISNVYEWPHPPALFVMLFLFLPYKSNFFISSKHKHSFDSLQLRIASNHQSSLLTSNIIPPSITTSKLVGPIVGFHLGLGRK